MESAKNVQSSNLMEFEFEPVVSLTVPGTVQDIYVTLVMVEVYVYMLWVSGDGPSTRDDGPSTHNVG